MSEIIHGDILDVVDKGVIVHQVNCVGVWGAGLALQMRHRYPLAYNEYMGWFNAGEWSLGRFQIVHVSADLSICNFAGQFFTGYGETSNWAYKTKMPSVFRRAEKDNLGKVYAPWRIGCGLGGGDWDTIRSIVEECGDVTWVRMDVT